jgi:predicted RNase H-like HicB family nuclease
MSDSYQAIYDAVRSRISNGDIGEAVLNAASRAFDISFFTARLQEQMYATAQEMQRPSAIFRPKLSIDGTSWCALLGADLETGLCAFGDTPSEAMTAFDQAYWKEHTPAAQRQINAIKREEAEQERQDNSQFGVGA